MDNYSSIEEKINLYCIIFNTDIDNMKIEFKKRKILGLRSNDHTILIEEKEFNDYLIKIRNQKLNKI